jgi:hypothetical protein
MIERTKRPEKSGKITIPNDYLNVLRSLIGNDGVLELESFTGRGFATLSPATGSVESHSILYKLNRNSRLQISPNFVDLKLHDEYIVKLDADKKIIVISAKKDESKEDVNDSEKNVEKEWEIKEPFEYFSKPVMDKNEGRSFRMSMMYRGRRYAMSFFREEGSKKNVFISNQTIENSEIRFCFRIELDGDNVNYLFIMHDEQIAYNEKMLLVDAFEKMVKYIDMKMYQIELASRLHLQTSLNRKVQSGK